MLGDAIIEKAPGMLTTCTGIVTGWNLILVKVTEKPLSAAGTATEQGVVQPGPTEVLASAPGGIESSWTCTVGGADLNVSSENDEQPARPAPATAITRKRRMIDPSRRCGYLPQSPSRTIGASVQGRNHADPDR